MLVSALLAQVACFGLVAASPLFLSDDKYDGKPKTKVSQKRYDNIARYAEFSAAAYRSSCPSPPFGTALHQTVDVGSTDTQSTIFRDDTRKEFIVAFAGSASARDGQTGSEERFARYELVQSVAKCKDCFVHSGFQKAWKSASKPVRDAMSLALFHYPDYNITVTGHSLGGALATMSFATLHAFDFPITKAYTYGQPRVGNQQYADYIDELSGASDDKVGTFHRVTHTYDGIPQVPGLEKGFRHSRTEFFQSDPLSAEETYRCYGQEAKDCSRAYGRGFLNPAHQAYGSIMIGEGSICGLG